jgi:hypothetical protein
MRNRKELQEKQYFSRNSTVNKIKVSTHCRKKIISFFKKKKIIKNNIIKNQLSGGLLKKVKQKCF